MSTAPLVESMGLFEMNKRPSRDRFWAIGYFIALGVCLAGGVVGLMSKSALYTILADPTYLDDASHCPNSKSGWGSLLGGMVDLPGMVDSLGYSEPSDPVDDLVRFLKSAVVLLLISLVAASLLAFIFLWLLQQHPAQFVIFTVLVQVGVPALLGNTTLAGFFFMLSTSLAVSFYVAKDSLQHMSRLLGLSARALRSNTSIITAVVSINIGLVIAYAAISAVGAMAATAGDVVAMPGRVVIPGQIGCRDSHGDKVRCCTWEPAPWVDSYAVVLSATSLWTFLLASQIKVYMVYMVSGATAQWYFSSVGSPTSVSAWTSLSHALGPSFGSLCLSSLVLTIIAYLRAALERFRKRRAAMSTDSLINMILGGIMSCMLALTEQLTKFATVKMSLSGHNFYNSGVEVVGLLRRNMMDAYNVWWLPGVVLSISSVFLSALWGYLIFLVAAHFPHSPPSYRVSMSLAWMSAIISYLALSFLVSILLNMVDATFVCFALDKDRSMVSQIEVHQVYTTLPSVGGGRPPRGGGGEEWGASGYAPPQIQQAGGISSMGYPAPPLQQMPAPGFQPSQYPQPYSQQSQQYPGANQQYPESAQQTSPFQAYSQQPQQYSEDQSQGQSHYPAIGQQPGQSHYPVIGQQPIQPMQFQGGGKEDAPSAPPAPYGGQGQGDPSAPPPPKGYQ
eukprot:gene17432-23735_t